MEQYAKIYNCYRDNYEILKICGFDDETNCYKVEKILGKYVHKKMWINVNDIYCIYLVKTIKNTVLEYLIKKLEKDELYNIKIVTRNGIYGVSSFIDKYADSLFNIMLIGCCDVLENNIKKISICAVAEKVEYSKFLTNQNENIL